MSDDRQPFALRSVPLGWFAGILWFVCGALAAVWVMRQTNRPTSAASPARVAASEPQAASLASPAPAPADRQAELADALATLNSTSRAEALRRLGRAMAADPQQGQALAASIINFDDRAVFLKAFLHAWASTDPENALIFAKSQPLGLLRSDSMAAACGGWATKHPEAAAAWARDQVAGVVRTKCLARVAESWASMDPAGASTWAASLPTGVLSEAALRECLGVWANQDPTAAAAWIAEQPEGRQRDVALLQLAADWASQEPQACAAWIAQRAQSHDDAESLAESLAATWSAYDAPAAGAWIASLPEGEVRQAAAVMAANAWVATDPAAATAWIESLEDPTLKNQLTLDMAATWASIDPSAALDYARSLPERALQHESMREIFGSWAMVDGPALDQWLTTQPADETTDLAREQLAVTRMANDPAGALAVAAAIASPETRDARVASLFTFWAQKNAAQARRWLRDAEIPSGLRPRLERLAASRAPADEED